MFKHIQSFCLFVSLVAGIPSLAQYAPGPGEDPSPEGALTLQAIESIEKSFEVTPAVRAAQNFLAANEIGTNVLDYRKTIGDDTLFTHVVKGGKISNQEQSGRCWLFAGLNVLRPAVIKKCHTENFEFSQAYAQFWDKLERANRTLELAIALRAEPMDSRKNLLLVLHPIEDGGDWNFVVSLLDKYGAVPKSIMPDTWSASHTAQMNSLLSTLIRKGIIAIRSADTNASAEQLRTIKTDTLKQVYRVLAMCLGQPPKDFKWRYEDKDKKLTPFKTYTPKQFYQEFVGTGLRDYMPFVNYPGKPMNRVLRFAWNRDFADGRDMYALNVTTEDMKKMGVASIMADEVVWFACNASVQRSSKAGLWDQGIQDYGTLFGLDFNMSKADGLACFQLIPNHAMALVGVNITDGKPDKWKVENSWGDKQGRDGFWTITDSWFDANVYEMLVNKKYVPENLQKLSQGEPIVMPPWDPFSN